MRVVKGEMHFENKWPSYEAVKASASLLEMNQVNGVLPKGIFAVKYGGRMRCAE